MEQGAGSREPEAGSRELGACSDSPLPAPGSLLPAPRHEYACGVLFMMLVPPYFILYDQTLLTIPLVMLWSSPAWRWGVALFATTTVLVVNLSLVLGFSLTGLAALAAMFFLTQSFDFLKSRTTFQLQDRITFKERNGT